MTPPSSSAGAGHPSSLNTSEPGNKVVDSAIKHDSNENNGNLKKSTMRTVVSLISVFVSMFLVALDRTIITTVRAFDSNAFADSDNSPLFEENVLKMLG